MLAGDTHPGGTSTAALEECSRVKISRLPVQKIKKSFEE